MKRKQKRKHSLEKIHPNLPIVPKITCMHEEITTTRLFIEVFCLQKLSPNPTKPLLDVLFLNNHKSSNELPC